MSNGAGLEGCCCLCCEEEELVQGQLLGLEVLLLLLGQVGKQLGRKRDRKTQWEQLGRGRNGKAHGVQVFTLNRSQSPYNHAQSFVSMSRRSLCALSVSPLSCVLNLTPTLLWLPSETFSFVLTGEDGSRWFGYCRKLLVSISGRAGGTESPVWALSGCDFPTWVTHPVLLGWCQALGCRGKGQDGAQKW